MSRGITDRRRREIRKRQKIRKRNNDAKKAAAKLLASVEITVVDAVRPDSPLRWFRIK